MEVIRYRRALLAMKYDVFKKKGGYLRGTQFFEKFFYYQKKTYLCSI